MTDPVPQIPDPDEAHGLTADPNGVDTAVTGVVLAVIALLGIFDVLDADELGGITAVATALIVLGKVLWVRRYAWKPGSVIAVTDAVRAGDR